MVRKRWENKEDKLIIKEVKNNPNNLQECFRVCSIKLNRTPNAIAMRWYYHISRKKSSCFMILSPIAGIKNRKNSKYNHKLTITKNIWNSLVKLFR